MTFHLYAKQEWISPKQSQYIILPLNMWVVLPFNVTDRILYAMDTMPEVEYPDIYINILSLYTKEDLKAYKY